MKKKLIAFVGLALLLTFVVAAVSHFRQLPVWLSVSSPNKTYTLQLTGNKSPPSLPVGENETRFNLFKSGELVVRNGSVDSYDWFDSGFAEQYPNYKWVGESILRFGYEPANSEKSADSLTVSNLSNKSVRYLKITAGDMLFVFDVPPGSQIKLPVPHPPADQSWIAGEGVFVGGQTIRSNGVKFPFPNQMTGGLTYCLRIDESAINIASPVMDGYNGDATPEKPNVSRVANCDSPDTRR